MRVFLISMVLFLQSMFHLCKANDFDLNNFTQMQVQLADSQQSGKKDWRQKEVSFAYERKAVSEIVRQILEVAQFQDSVVGLEKLNSRKPSKVAMKKVKAHKAITTLLKCEGFRLQSKGEQLNIEHDSSINRKSCLM